MNVKVPDASAPLTGFCLAYANQFPSCLPGAFVQVGEEFYRRNEQHVLLGEASKATERLGWRPEVGFEDLVERMVAADLRRVEARSRAPSL